MPAAEQQISNRLEIGKFSKDRLPVRNVHSIAGLGVSSLAHRSLPAFTFIAVLTVADLNRTSPAIAKSGPLSGEVVPVGEDKAIAQIVATIESIVNGAAQAVEKPVANTAGDDAGRRPDGRVG